MENTQKVRHIPIFVEGRDEPIINRGHDGEGTGGQSNASAPPPNSSNNTSAFASAESSSGPHQQSHHSFGRPPMGFVGDMGFGQDIPLPSGSIFDRTKDFPVRDFFNMRSASPRRSESPINAHYQASQQQQPNQNQSRNSPSPAGRQQQQRQPTPQNNQDRSVPVQHDTKRATTPQRAQTPQGGQEQQPEAPPAPQAIPAKQKAIEDSITKIQKIQASVLDLMLRVEQYDGGNRKEYNFLDEMLTQNLLKLDDIDAEGKENIKNARREAIKCINSLISLLEAKNDEAAAAAKAGNQTSESRNQVEATSTSMQQDLPTQNGINGASKNSSYDNVSSVKQTSSNNSVNMADASKIPCVSAEVSLEAKVQEAMQKQN